MVSPALERKKTNPDHRCYKERATHLYERRKARLKEICLEFKEQIYPPKRLSKTLNKKKFWWIEQNNLVYCHLPKVSGEGSPGKDGN